MKNKCNITDSDCPLILKSGATDLRRQERALTKIVEQNYSEGVKTNVLYGFSNKSNTTIKLLKINPDSSTMLIKLKRNIPYPWFEYEQKSMNGYTVTLAGEKKKEFLEKIDFKGDL